MGNSKQRCGMAWFLAFVMVLSTVLSVPSFSLNAEAASKKYVKSLSVKKNVTVVNGSKVTVKPSVKVANKASTKVTVKSKNTKIAKASYSAKTKKITIQGKKQGSTKVTVTTVAKNKKGKKISKTINVKVTKKNSNSNQNTSNNSNNSNNNNNNNNSNVTPTIPVSNVTVSQNTLALLKGEKSTLTAKVTPDTATNKKVKWTVSPSGIVSLTADGLSVAIDAVAAGTATITATAADGSGKSASCTVEVQDIVTVTTQSQLDSVLANAKVGKIILDVSNGSYTISAGQNSDTELVINGAGATVTNSGTFKSVTLSGGTYVEKAAGNQISVTAPSKVTVSDSASVSLIDVAIPEDATTTDRSVTIVNDGTVDQINIASSGTVTLSGSGTGAIAANISSKDVKLVTNQSLNLKLTEKAELVFRSTGADDGTGSAAVTTISADTPDHTPDIYGVGQYTVTYDDGSQSKDVIAEVSDDIEPVEDLYGTVEDAFNTGAIEGVAVYLIPASQYDASMSTQDGEIATTGNGITAVTTDANGDYSFGETKSGNYYLVMVKDGYKRATQFLAVSSDYKTRFDVEKMELLESEQAATVSGSLFGKIIDGATGNGISGITVELRKNKGFTVGDTIATVITGENGTYSFENSLEADQYTVRIVDNREAVDSKYITRSANVCIKGSSTELNITTSGVLSGEGIRFVLRWGNEESGAPEDLDSHLYGPRAIGSGTFEVYFSEKVYGAGNDKYAELDVDDTDYEGPETTTIVKPIDGVYYYYVHNFDESTFYKSSAVVEVYAGNELITTYSVPEIEGSTEDWWKVCSYNSRTKRFTSYNTLQEEDPYSSSELHHGYEQLITGVTSSEPSYLDASKTGIYSSSINLYGGVSWNVIKDTLQFQTLSGYTAELSESSDDEAGVVNVKDLSGSVVGTYSIYYQQEMTLTVGDYSAFDIAQIAIYNQHGYIAIYAPSSFSSEERSNIMEKLSFACADSSYNSFLYSSASSDNVGYLTISNGTDSHEYEVYWFGDCYVTNVTQSGTVVDDWYEYDDELDIYGISSLDGIQIECLKGYTATIDSNKGIVEIKDSTGVVVKSKRIYSD